MAGDLGAWPPAQATVLLEVLKKAGLDPQAKRTREGIQVTVPDEQLDDANRLLVANMDEIAQAARSPAGGRRRPRANEPRSRPARASTTRTPSGDPGERVNRIALPLGILLLVIVLTRFLPQVAFPLLVVATGVVIYLIGKRIQRENGDGGR